MPTECSGDLFGFAPVEGRRVEAAFDGGDATSDAGAVLLGATDRAIGLVSRDAQYVPPLDYVKAGIISEEESRNEKIGSELGLAHVPAGRGPGGIRVRGEIRRDALINLTTLHAFGATDGDATTIRRYILGLALVALTAPGAHNLRQGCLLVRHPERPSEWTVVGHNGVREAILLPHEDVRKFAERAAEAFGVGEERTAFFNAKDARSAVDEVKKGRSKKGGS